MPDECFPGGIAVSAVEECLMLVPAYSIRSLVVGGLQALQTLEPEALPSISTLSQNRTVR